MVCIGMVAVVGALLFYKTFQSEELPTATFGDTTLHIEYATTTASRERGLGGRASIPSDYGMFFVFAKADRYGFWMKDTLVPLDIFWLDDKGHVVYIATNVATSSYPNVFYPSAPAKYVLETQAGFASLHHVQIGSSIRLKNVPIVSE